MIEGDFVVHVNSILIIGHVDAYSYYSDYLSTSQKRDLSSAYTLAEIDLRFVRLSKAKGTDAQEITGPAR